MRCRATLSARKSGVVPRVTKRRTWHACAILCKWNARARGGGKKTDVRASFACRTALTHSAIPAYNELMPRGRNFFDEVLSATGAGAAYFYLPLPPSVYEAQEPGDGRATARNEEPCAYRRKVADIVASDFAQSSPFEGNVEVRILLRFTSFRRIDIDNHIKPLIDALTQVGVWKDENQLHSVSVVRELFDGDEHCVVEVAECSAISRGLTALADLMHGDSVLEEYLTGPEGAR